VIDPLPVNWPNKVKDTDEVDAWFVAWACDRATASNVNNWLAEPTELAEVIDTRPLLSDPRLI